MSCLFSNEVILAICLRCVRQSFEKWPQLPSPKFIAWNTDKRRLQRGRCLSDGRTGCLWFAFIYPDLFTEFLQFLQFYISNLITRLLSSFFQLSLGLWAANSIFWFVIIVIIIIMGRNLEGLGRKVPKWRKRRINWLDVPLAGARFHVILFSIIIFK